MAQFDVFRNAAGQLLVDCQSDALGYLGTRLATPLLPVEQAPELRARLNPVFDIDGVAHALMTQFATAVTVKELRIRVVSLDSRRFDIVGAFDMLLTGV